MNMQQKVVIKGKTLGEGKPLICVPVMGEKKELVIEQVRRLVDMKAQMIEWRIDAFENVSNPDAVNDVLEELRSITENTILVYTYRSKAQGGLGNDSRDTIEKLYRVGAKSDVVDFVDVEFFANENCSKLISELKKEGAKIIASHHDFDETPEEKIMKMLLEEMYNGRADIVKLAVMPQKASDVISLIKVTEEFKQIHSDGLIITMSMGALGAVSRIAGQLSGSCVTFGAGEVASAPGQLPFTKLDEILSLIEY